MRATCNGDPVILYGYNYVSTIAFNANKIQTNYLECLDNAKGKREIIHCLKQMYYDVDTLSIKLDNGKACSYIRKHCNKKDLHKLSKQAVKCYSQSGGGASKAVHDGSQTSPVATSKKCIKTELKK